MNTDHRRAEEESKPPEAQGFAGRLRAAIAAKELRVIDRAIDLFKRWHDRLAPPEEDSRQGRHRAFAQFHVTETPAPVPAPRSRFRRILIVAGLMAASAAAGSFFSYHLLQSAIESEGVIIDDLRDQVAQAEKADQRNLSIQAQNQVQMAEYRKTLREYEAKLQAYEEQAAQLREKIAALTPPPPPAVVTTSKPSAAARSTQKAGNCVASGRNAGTDAARCIESFNRP